MRLQAEGIRNRWRRSPEFLAAQRELKPFLDVAADMLRLRLKLGFSHEQLAERVGTKQANISRVEAGLSNPTLKFLQRIADALDAELVIALQPRSMERRPTDETRFTRVSQENEQSFPVLDWPVRSACGTVDLKSTASQKVQRIEA